MSVDSVSSAERLTSLFLALTTSESVTRDDLFATVTGYRQRVQMRASEKSLVKLFERDKQALRELGIEVQLSFESGHDGDLRYARYGIEPGATVFPAGLSFTDEELTLLRAAQLAWLGSPLHKTSREALIKLDAITGDVRSNEIDVLPYIGGSGQVMLTLKKAVEKRKNVVFSYRPPNQPYAFERRVSPLCLHLYAGRWHLLSFDQDIEKPRVFLLQRILGDVQVTGEDFSPSLFETVDELIASLQNHTASQTARIRVRAGTPAHASLAARAQQAVEHSGSWVELTVTYTDAQYLLRELLRYGTDVSLISPEELSLLRVEMLNAVALLHAPGDDAISASTTKNTVSTKKTVAPGKTQIEPPQTPQPRETRAFPAIAGTKDPGHTLNAGESFILRTALVPYLLSKGIVSVADTAKHFKVDAKTIERSVRALAVTEVASLNSAPSEVPININWDLLEQEKLLELTQADALDQFLSFSPAEAAALVCSLNLLLEGQNEKERTVTFKLSQKLTETFVLNPSNTIISASGKVTDPRVLRVREALAKNEELEFDYVTRNGDKNHRIVSPIRLVRDHGNWYLDAYCFNRNARRIFSLWRATGITLAGSQRELPQNIEKNIEKNTGSDVAKTKNTDVILAGSTSATETITVKIPESELSTLESYNPRKVCGTEEGQIIIEIDCWDEGLALQLALQHPGVLQVQKPVTAKETVFRQVSNLLAVLPGIS